MTTDRDALRFWVWRRRWVLVGTGISFAMVAAGGLGFWAGRVRADGAVSPGERAGLGGTSRTGRSDQGSAARPLAEALRAAEAALPPMAESGLTLGTAFELEQKRQLQSETYRKVLKVGEPVVFGGLCAGLSVEVASRMRPQEREDWLRACLEVAKDRYGVQKRLQNIESLHGMKWVAGILLYDEPYSTLEAIYNVSGDANLRLDAKRAFDSLAAEDLERALSASEHVPEGYRRLPGPRPKQRQIADWGHAARRGP